MLENQQTAGVRRPHDPPNPSNLEYLVRQTETGRAGSLFPGP
jgi:hypothetical protein